MNDNILKQLKKLKPILKERYGIEEFAIFGSVAKGCNKENSDIDIVILKMNFKSGFDIVRAQQFLEKLLKRKVDIGSFHSMNSFIKSRIKKDLIYV